MHLLGCKAKAIIDAARAEIASMVGGTKEDIIFTSGGTEVIISNNIMAVRINYNQGKKLGHLCPF